MPQRMQLVVADSSSNFVKSSKCGHHCSMRREEFYGARVMPTETYHAKQNSKQTCYHVFSMVPVEQSDVSTESLSPKMQKSQMKKSQGKFLSEITSVHYSYIIILDLKYCWISS